MENRWNFINENGAFEIMSPQNNSYLYFPLANEAGMMSSITPNLNGDIKTGQNTFFSLPVSGEDLHNTKTNRNFWLHIEGKGPWSVSGASSQQISQMFMDDSDDSVSIQAGLLWHTLIRENAKPGIRAEVTSFVPVISESVELMRVTIKNIGKEKIEFTPTSAIPVYGRSAENIRDHRNVTSLLNRVFIVNEGIEVQPAMTFDERGHRVNEISYNVYGIDDAGAFHLSSFPVMEEYIGEGGNLEWPETVVCNLSGGYKAGDTVEDYEAVGALRFENAALNPGQEKPYILALSITKNRDKEKQSILNNLGVTKFEELLEANKKYWEENVGKISFNSSDRSFDMWMKWVALQPILRRIYGCSFMPHHDYGKGGRGWRDLWQDCLALLLMDAISVRKQLLNNFGGVRFDGTNATIIGKGIGEFVADRNNISRVWSDHGVWPFFTTNLYINQTGDLDFLFEKMPYFKDRLIMRSRKVDENWTSEYGNKHKCKDGQIYEGTILEHILIQNLTSFYNAGDNNNIRIENADWNDAFDMAADKGETVAFTAFYAGNLREISDLLLKLKEKKGIAYIELAAETLHLFDTLGDCIDYNDAEAKRNILKRYCSIACEDMSGSMVKMDTVQIANDLRKKADWLMKHISENEFVEAEEKYQWFNGYYDNSGRRVEGESESGVRMTLTGQVFPIMMTAKKKEIEKAVLAVERYLYDKRLGSYRLNNDFKETKLDLGRCFGFAFGHKENGAVFSHMTTMYSFALYKRGFVRDGYKVLKSLYGISTNFEKARIYPGIPEYFNERGRGMYHYLTGSASWFMLLMLTEVYGVKGILGDLVIAPKLVKEQFNEAGIASVKAIFAGRKIEIVYINEKFLDAGDYKVEGIVINQSPVEYTDFNGSSVISRAVIEALDNTKVHKIEIKLGYCGEGIKI